MEKGKHDFIIFDEATNFTKEQWEAAGLAGKTLKLSRDLAEDPAGLCPARCDTERYWGHSYVNGVCEYCDRVED